LNEVMLLGLSLEDIEALEARTEGWVVGLQMAALSLRGHENASEFIRAFSGSHRFVLDYLVEEVLKRQSEHIQTFLLRTSILEKLNGSLCDALIVEESKKAGQNGQEVLEYLERSNLFVVALDDHKQWYRYHHLFADLLRARLDQLYPGLSRQLHTHAATWFEHQGMMVEAVTHALAAREYDRAARLVEQNTTRLLAQGELNALMGWIETLPAEVRLKRPWLCVHQAYVLIFAGRTTEVEPLLAQAEATLGIVSGSSTTSINDQTDETDAPSMSTAEARALRGAIAAVRAFAAAIMMQDAEALSQAQRARKLLAAEDLFNLSLVYWALGYALHSRGQLAEARAAFEEQIRLGRTMQNNATLMIGLTALARVLGDQGKLDEARTLMEDALAEARQKGIRNLGFIARLEAHLAGVLYEQNELEGAHRLLSDALTRAPFWLNPNHRAFIYSYLARVSLAKGDVQGARMAIDEADKIRRDARLSHWLRNSLEVEIVQIWLALQSVGIRFLPSDPLVEQSNLILAGWKRKLAGYIEEQNQIVDQHVEMALLTLARLSLASCQVEEALALLQGITNSSRAAGHISAAIEALVLTAMALQSKSASNTVPALAALQEALALAEPGGYVRVFINQGKLMHILVAEWLARAEAGPLQDYALRLLSHFDAEPCSDHLGFTQPLSRDNP
ncbi:MAG TPA: hypothetical protein VK206_16935, partial [Anaerolineales bacterium]|nr:hypothetical protein [Anaerolineales bacterium]